ncbi:cistern family PEP-CTERM protein [Synechococcales cyanobacterium C]|uniref:Cistern family PEP-CTERM protein n=1 Tax=Petrachloros mirabilis ULC683 TaxID=2781853 RepID=A0A8K1ZXM3_9CYAN|nr:cistern family PEP-CTERM protein [Petrachloros mirabilis]NCJ05967.1 cistern family PEP-CTERM protein [Petrachloros mirabilis ULC683]
MAKITSAFFSLAAASLLAGLVHAPANAFSLTPSGGISFDKNSVGSAFTVDFDGNVDKKTVSGLTSQAVFTLTSFNNKTATFDVALTNTSSNPITKSRVTGLGFNANSHIVSANASGTLGKAVVGGAFPNGFGSVDICFTSGPTCQGGGGGGVNFGQTGNFSTSLTFSQSLSTLTLDNFGVRYQSIDGLIKGKKAKDASGTGFGTPHGTPHDPVPEPASMLGLLAFGALGGGALKRKKAKANMAASEAPSEKELTQVE